MSFFRFSLRSLPVVLLPSLVVSPILGPAVHAAQAAQAAQEGMPPAAPAPAPAPGTPPATTTPPTTETAPVETRILSVDAAVRQALQRNPSLDEAEASIRRAQAVVSEARALQLPRLDSNVTFTVQGPIPSFTTTIPSTTPGEPARMQTITFGKTFTRSIGVQATYDADLFGRLRAGRTRAGQLVNVSRGSYFVVQNELAFSVQNVFLAALRAQELIRVAKEAVDAAQEQLRVAEAQLRAGTAPEFDVLRASVQVANNRQSVVANEAVYRRTLSMLAELLSLEPNTRIELVPVALPPEPDSVAAATAQEILTPAAPESKPDFGGIQGGGVPPSLETALAEAFNRRPEVYRAEWARRAAQSLVRVERTGNLPNLGLSAGFSFNPDQAGFAVEEKTYSLVANLTIPLWDAGVTRARVRQAKADVDIAAAQLKTARNTVTQEVRQAYIDLQEAIERRRAASANTAQAREALRIARVRYAAGLAPNVEVTDAQAALTQASSNEVNAAYDYLNSLATLNRSLGRYASETLATMR